MRCLSCGFALSALLFLAAGMTLAQDTSSSATATCNFDPTKQVAVRYQRISVNVKKKALGNTIPYGKVWAPGGKPMTLFTDTAVTIGGHDLPVGAYTLFVIPDERTWTLIVSKSSDVSGKYDEHDDLARVTMHFGKLSRPEPQFSVYFAHEAPTKCNMRLDLQKARAWIDIDEKK